MYTKKIKLRKSRRGGMNPRQTLQRKPSARSLSAPPVRPAPVIPGSISTTRTHTDPIDPSLMGKPGGRGKGKGRGRGSQLSRTPSMGRGTGSATSVQTINAVSPVTTINALSPAAPINTVSPVTPSVQSINAVSPAAPSSQPTPSSSSKELERIKMASAGALKEMKDAVDKLAAALVPSINQTSQSATSEQASSNGSGSASTNGTGAASANGTGAASANGAGAASTETASTNGAATASANGAGAASANGASFTPGTLPLTQPQANKLGEKTNTLGGGDPVPTDLYYPKNSYLTPT